LTETLTQPDTWEAPLVEAEPVTATDTLYVVGFAPSWQETPWDVPNAHYWGMNALHKVAPDKPWSMWFQLHDIDKHHKEDREEHLDFLRKAPVPIVMWQDHIPKYDIPNAVPYPKQMVVDHFGRYFTNTVSWMLAFAIISKQYRKIGVYGIDMAQDSEYDHQRPSCEYFLGWAKGQGIELDIPDTSDLLKAPFLYGLEDGDPLRIKYEARLADLNTRKAEVEAAINQGNAQMGNHQAILHQILGAIEDTKYWLRVWSQPVNSDGKKVT
jgi:hypothetical protein